MHLIWLCWFQMTRLKIVRQGILMMVFVRVFFVLMLFFAVNGYAGKYSDALGQCLVNSTTVDDRNKLIVWMFSASSQHPVVRNMITVSDAELNRVNKEFADLTMKLLTVDCKLQAKIALKEGGLASLQSSFKVFAEVAGRELFASPQVARAMSGYVKHLDIVRLGLIFR